MSYKGTVTNTLNLATGFVFSQTFMCAKWEQVLRTFLILAI